MEPCLRLCLIIVIDEAQTSPRFLVTVSFRNLNPQERIHVVLSNGRYNAYKQPFPTTYTILIHGRLSLLLKASMYSLQKQYTAANPLSAQHTISL